MTIEKREQVFVSSTFSDLQEARQATIQTLLEADCFPVGMEFFPASDNQKWELIKRVIGESDYYIVIIGGRYGSVTEEGLSYTEMEFDYAEEKGLPIMAFLHGDPGSIAVDLSDIDPEMRRRLEGFRNKAGQRMAKFWDAPSDLAAKVALSLIQIRKSNPADGWIRSENALTPEVEREIGQLRVRVAELTNQLQQANTAASDLRLDLDFERGQDSFDVKIEIAGVTQEQSNANNTYRARKYLVSIPMTWDEMFAAVAPRLIDEGNEWQMDKALLEGIAPLVDRFPSFPEGVVTWGEYSLAKGILDSVIVQFFSLGLIEKSLKKHALDDTHRYWTLTQEGQDHLMRTRAIRRSNDADDEEGDDDVQELKGETA